MSKHFSLVILSSWESDPTVNKRKNLIQIKTKLPINRGLNNRNLQRLSTAKGIELAKEHKIDWILKWRSDFLPTNFRLQYLVDKTENGKRIVFPAFRNLSVQPDFFSSFPDYFAFGSLDMIDILWSNDSFDYSKNINIPKNLSYDKDVIIKDDRIFYQDKEYTSNYDPHIELYVLFRHKLYEIHSQLFTHPEIIRNFFQLIDHDELKICWFNINGGFRSIEQAIMYPWWKVKTQKTGKIQFAKPGYKLSISNKFIGKYLSKLVVVNNIRKQQNWLKSYLKKEKK